MFLLPTSHALNLLQISDVSDGEIGSDEGLDELELRKLALEATLKKASPTKASPEGSTKKSKLPTKSSSTPRKRTTSTGRRKEPSKTRQTTNYKSKTSVLPRKYFKRLFLDQYCSKDLLLYTFSVFKLNKISISSVI